MKRATEDAKRSHEELAASYEQITATEEQLRQTIDDLGVTERFLRESEEKYRTVFENTGTAMVLLEEDMMISLANTEFLKLSGFPKEEIEGKKTWVEFVVAEDRDRMLAQHRLRRQNHEKALTWYEFRFVTRSGDIRAIYLTIDIIPGTKKSVASLLDITERRRADAEVTVVNRLYAVLSATDNAIVHIPDKKELLNEICRIVVDTGGFSMAWAGIANGKTHLIEPVGSAGHIEGYLDTIAISTDDTPRGRGPTGTAFRTGTFNVCNDIGSDPKMAPWREGALGRGYRSLAAFPFARNTANAGVITFYASEPGFFTNRIIRLLEEQSGNISFALEALDHAGHRIAAEQDLKESELRYRRLFETAKDGILILDAETGKIIDANPYILEILGYPIEYFLGKHLWELGFIKDKSIAERAFSELSTKSYVRYEDIPLEKKDGQRMDVEFISNSYLVGDTRIIQCNIRNITGRKLAEKALRESDERYRSLFTTMEEGFCIIEMIFGENNKPVDYRFIEVNPAFERHTGLTGAVGRRIRDLAPNHEGYWFETYGKIALTGEPAHFENYAREFHRWYYVYAFRVGPPEKRLVSVLFSDITDRKLTEDSLKNFSENLEREVTERTSELSDANQKLMTEIGIRIDAEKHLTQSVSEKEVLLREVHHRVKNNLQIIVSLLNLQSRFITDETTLTAFKESQSRVRAMALVHEKLYQSSDLATIDLENYLRFLGDNLFQFLSMKGKGIRLAMEVHGISLAIDTAIPLGLMINELISNSLKYAFPDGRTGEISLAIRRQDHTLTILFKDNGIGIPDNFDWRNGKSLGLRLVISLVEQLDGTIELDRRSGTAFTIVVKEKV